MIVDVKTHAPGQLFDANGAELLYAVWADTETGEAAHLIREGGRFKTTIDDTGHEVVMKEWRQHPAPLRYVSGRT